MPSDIPCNSVPNPPFVQGFFELSPAIAGLGAGAEYEFRLQLRGNNAPIPSLFVFYAIDTSQSTIAIAGSLAPPPPPPADPPPPDLSHTDISNQSESNIIGGQQQSESNIISNQNSALGAVKAALGVVEGNLNASIAGAVLKVNAETAIGIDRLANQLGVQGADLALAIKGNGNAIGNVQKAIEEKLLPEVLRNQNLIQANSAAILDVGKNFLDKLLGQALSTGGRILDFYAGGGILQVADFVKRSITQVIDGNLRPDRVFKRAIAEFNRGLRRIRNIFRGSSSLSAADAEKYSSLLAADLPGGDETGLGADTESQDVFGAYVWFERAYQTLVKGSTTNGTVK